MKVCDTTASMNVPRQSSFFLEELPLLLSVLPLVFGPFGCGSGGSGGPSKNPCAEHENACVLVAWDPSVMECVVAPVDDGAPCDDGDGCTVDDSCTDGQCVGEPNPCTNVVDECNDGACANGTCAAQPRPDGTACPSETNACNDGACQSGTCVASAKADGTTCTDGLYCTYPDACEAGVCVGADRDCDDGLDCTVDACDGEALTCVHEIASGQCSIAGACYADGDLNPYNLCEHCAAAERPDAWSPSAQTTCDDGNLCTENDRCQDGVCLGDPTGGCCEEAADCDDGMICTQEICDLTTGACANPVRRGSCLIGGQCYADAELNPGNSCQSCMSDVSLTAWTDNANPCSDNQFCTGNDACAGGVCVGEPGVVCDDGVACTTDTCNEQDDTCSHALDAGFCLVGDECAADGHSPAHNDCVECDAVSAVNVWSMRGDGASCMGGSVCSSGGTCSQGVCTGGAIIACDDGLDCTTDFCSDAEGGCTARAAAGWCAIDGVCLADGTIDAETPCRKCDSALDRDQWSDTDAVCDDLDFCTVHDRCVDGSCRGVERSCDDGLDCTIDSCDSVAAACERTVEAGFCRIGGACYVAGAAKPGNPCLRCIPETSIHLWTSDDTSTCSDGLSFTSGDACSDGQCVGSPAAGSCSADADCDDGSSCTDDACATDSGTCSNTLQSDHCLVAGVCYGAGMANPDNACEVCDAATSAGQFTAAADGAPCEDGSFCQRDSTCTAGVCAGGVPKDCSDGVSCTADLCNEVTDACEHPVLAGYCLIGDACYAHGTTKPDAQCLSCQSDSDASTWQATPNGTACGGVCQWCQEGACVDVSASASADPGGSCPVCQVCDGVGGCVAVADDTDPKDDCHETPCAFSTCQAGACDKPAGAQCTDLSPGDCQDAQCDADGTCIQDAALEAGGQAHACRPAESPCDAAEYCDGAGSLCPPDVLSNDPSKTCRPAEGECDVAETCDGVSAFCPQDVAVAAGTACTDPAPQDCMAAACDGLGACAPGYAYETSDTTCDDGDACTVNDSCDTVGQCRGETTLNQYPSEGSEVTATSECLMAATSARSVVSVALVDLAGAPIEGASVEIEADDPGVTWLGEVVEASVEGASGVYYRIMQPPAWSGDTLVTVHAQIATAACSSDRVLMNRMLQITFRDPVASGVGGCPIDGNLRVQVVASESGTPLEGARVLLGPAEELVYQHDYEAALAGQPPSVSNTALTDATGTAEIYDVGGQLSGPTMVTVGYEGRSYMTLVDIDASDIVVPLDAVTGQPPLLSHLYGGGLTPASAYSEDYDSRVSAGFVIAELSQRDLLRFSFSSILSAEEDCFDALPPDSELAALAQGAASTPLPSNLFIPAQSETVIFGGMTIELVLSEHSYTAPGIPRDAGETRFVSLVGNAPTDTLIAAMISGGDLAAVIPVMGITHLGTLTADMAGDHHDVDIPIDVQPSASAVCTFSAVPAGSQGLCVALGDWQSGRGPPSFFPMGVAVPENGEASVTVVADSGDFAGISYAGAGVVTFPVNADTPEGDRWKENAVSVVLQRSVAGLSGSGGEIALADFLDFVRLEVEGRTYSFAPDTSTTAAEVTLAELRARTQQYRNGDADTCATDVSAGVWEETYWRILTPGDVTGFTLPTLPDGWPRAVAGDDLSGLKTPDGANNESLVWYHHLLHLGAGSQTQLDYNQLDFSRIDDYFTRSSSNSLIVR